MNHRDNTEQIKLLFQQEELKTGQLTFAEVKEFYEEHWQEMPEFVQEDLMPWKSIYVHFECLEHLQQFSELVQQPMTSETAFIWYPEAEKAQLAKLRYVDTRVMYRNKQKPK